MLDGFIAISGYVPSGAVLYNNSGDQIYIILQAHINSIYPSPDYKSVVLAGFGNLSGDIYVYDLQQMKKTAQFKKDKVVTFSWSPDGLYFLMATTFPRLRVNNSYHIYSKEGKYVFH